MTFKLDISHIIYPKDPTATPERIEQYEEIYGVKYEICKTKNPKKIVEIGVRCGYAAFSFLQACPNAVYIGFDNNNGTHGGRGGEDGSFFKWAEKILDKYNVKLIELDTQTVDNLNIYNVDLFHVDGDHTTEGVMHDLDLAYKAINDYGLILVDDMDYLDTVKKGVNEWLYKKSSLVSSIYKKSLRGEMLIWKKERVL